MGITAGFSRRRNSGLAEQVGVRQQQTQQTENQKLPTPMKYIKLLAIALIVGTTFAFAQTPPSTPVIPDHLSIGQVATAETLAKATQLRVDFGQPGSSREWFTTTVPLDNITCIEDVGEVAKTVSFNYVVDSVKDPVNLTVLMIAADGTPLFKSGSIFNMEKVYDGATSKFVWQMPEWSRYLSFQLMDSSIYFAGANEAYLVRRDNRGEGNEVYNLSVQNGYILLPGGWNRASVFKELVINNSLHYDMNTGLLLPSTLCHVNPTYVWVDGIEPVSVNGNSVTITNYPQYGYLPSYEVTVVNRYFKLEVINENRYWVHPIAVRVASLQDLRPGGQGWTTIPYSRDMNIPVASPGTYYVVLEYRDDDIGNGISTPVTEG